MDGSETAAAPGLDVAPDPGIADQLEELSSRTSIAALDALLAALPADSQASVGEAKSAALEVKAIAVHVSMALEDLSGSALFAERQTDR